MIAAEAAAQDRSSLIEGLWRVIMASARPRAQSRAQA